MFHRCEPRSYKQMPHPLLCCIVFHLLHGKATVKRGGGLALLWRYILVWHRAASEVGLGGLLPSPQSRGP